jgi:hypothetical protein
MRILAGSRFSRPARQSVTDGIARRLAELVA